MKKEEFIFCPLGGSGEIGMNMNLYAYGNENNKKWIIVDMGVSFADDSVPGIDLIIPDAGFIIDKKDDLRGIVLTHAHEDDIGSVSHIWPSLKFKIYATPFTAALLVEKFQEKFAAEYKLDGERAQIHKHKDKIEIFSRSLEIITSYYPDIVEKISKLIISDDVILEAEVVAMNSNSGDFLPFQELMHRRRKYEIDEAVAKYPITVNFFDVLFSDR